MREYHLKNKHMDLTILPEAGCHWPSLKIPVKGEWLDLLYPVDDYASILTAPSSLGSYMMVPWSNRIPEGKFKFEGKDYQVKINFPDNTTIHGDVRKRPWKVNISTDEKFGASLNTADFEDFNYPFKLQMSHAVELNGPTLIVEMEIENTDSKNAPVGIGFHPFFKRQIIAGAEDPVLILPADKVYPDEACIPTGPAEAVSGDADLRSSKPLGTPNLDHCYTGLTDNKIKLSYANPKLELEFEVDEIYSHAVIYVPNNEQNGPQEFFAIEPVTHVNDGFNLHERGWEGTGIKVLKPGEAWGGSWKLTLQNLATQD